VRVFNVTTAGQLAVLVTRLDVTGRFVWASALAGPGYYQGLGIAVDASENVFTIGSFRGTVDFEPGEGMSRVDRNVCAL
jgi:hypothetical protein